MRDKLASVHVNQSASDAHNNMDITSLASGSGVKAVCRDGVASEGFQHMLAYYLRRHPHCGYAAVSNVYGTISMEVTSKSAEVDAREVIRETLERVLHMFEDLTNAAIHGLHVPGVELMTGLEAQGVECDRPPTLQQVLDTTKALEARLYTSRHGLLK